MQITITLDVPVGTTEEEVLGALREGSGWWLNEHHTPTTLSSLKYRLKWGLHRALEVGPEVEGEAKG